MSEVLTVSQVAKRLGCRRWCVQRIFEDGLLPEPGKIGAFRAIPVERLPEIRRVLKDRGYIK